jgi:tetratricopeptide (TPR) repeat protein
MTNRLVIVAAAASFAVSCTREVRVAQTPASIQPTVWERQVRNAKDAGDGDYELKSLRARMAAEPDSIAARLDMAKAYQERGFPEVALEICRLAGARFPESGDVELALVRSLRDLNRRPEAIEGLEAFLKTHPQASPNYLSWVGILRDEAGQWTLGEPAHRAALEIEPSRDSLHNNLGYNLLMQKKGEEAAAEFREALRLNPASQVARNNLGLALATSNAMQAIANWQAAGDPAAAHNNLAAVWIEKGNYTEARKELNIALGYNRALSAALGNMQLVSRLDGNAATLPERASDTRWERWKSGFRRLFVGPLDDPKPAAKTASTGITGEDR